MAAGAHHLARVRVEGEQHGRQFRGATALDRPPDDLLVPAVYAVEDADRHDASAPTRRCRFDPPPALHAALLVALPSPVDRRRQPATPTGARVGAVGPAGQLGGNTTSGRARPARSSIS